MSVESLESLNEGLNIHIPADWMVFADRLKDAIRCGRAKEIPKLRQIYLPSELWFADTVSGEIYVYLRPDDRILPEWTKIEAFKAEKNEKREPDLKSVNEVGLRAIPTGKMDKGKGVALFQMLSMLSRRGVIEVVSTRCPASRLSENVLVSTYRDEMNDCTYEFVEYPESKTYSWSPITVSN